MRIVIRIVFWAVAAVLFSFAGIYAYLRNADLSVYEAQIESFLSDRVGYEIKFGGLFDLHFGKITRVTAEQISITNPEILPDSPILTVNNLSLSFELWSLIRGPLIIQDIDLEYLGLHLQRNEAGQGNWVAAGATPDAESMRQFDFGELVVFRRLRVEDAQATIVNVSQLGPLNINLDYLTVTPDSNNMLDLDLQATVNELPVSADGKLGPWTNFLDGRDIATNFELLFGESRLEANGNIADLNRLEGVNATLKLQGPEIRRIIDVLGMPPFATGDFIMTAGIDAQDSETLIDLDGQLGEIRIVANGSVEKIIRPLRAELDFDVSGPDAKYVAELFNVEDVIQAPFQVAGRVGMVASKFSFTNTKAQFAAGELLVDGWIDMSRAIPDIDVTVNASGPDLSVVGPLAGLRGIPAEAFEGRGHIVKNGETWRFDDFQTRVGSNVLVISGDFDANNTDVDQIDVKVSGPDISILQNMTGVQGLPVEPYDISVRIVPDTAGLRLQGGVGVIGENRIEVDGVLGLENSFDRTDLRVKASGPELHNVALLVGVPYLPTGPFEFSSRALIRNNTLTIENAKVVLTGIEIDADGSVSLAPAGEKFDLRFSTSGSDFSGLAEIDAIQQFAGHAFEIGGRISRNGEVFELEDVNAVVGTLQSAFNGDLALDGSSFDIRVRADAPSAEVLEDFGTIENLPPGPVRVSGRVEKLGDNLEFSDAIVSIGEHRFTADGTLSTSPRSNRSDLRFGATGPEFRQLGLIIGNGMMPAIPYELAGEVNGTPSGFSIENLVVSIGENEIVAKFAADLSSKPTFTGTVSSTFIDLQSNLVRTTDPESDLESKPREFYFSDAALEGDWLETANVDIEFSTGRVLVNRADVRDLNARVRLWDGQLDINPLTFRESAGSLDGSVHLSSAANGLSLRADFAVENMHIGLKAEQDPDRSALPPLAGNFSLSGNGGSLHEILASSNGRMDFRYGAGRLRKAGSSLVLSDFFSEVIRTVNPMTRTQAYTNVECGILRVGINDGVATVDNLALQTDQLTFVSSGVINLSSEKIDMTLRAKPREGLGLSLGSVANSYLKLGGTLQNPGMKLDAVSSVTTTAAAAATGGLSLVARGLWDRLSTVKNICREPVPQ